LFAPQRNLNIDEAARMARLTEPSLVLWLAICFGLPANAQDKPLEPPPNTANMPSSTPLTAKERLGEKWMDEQRIDNCKVPVGKRGPKPRPSTCPHVPMG
jgi:hypothetical protein